MVRSVIVFLTGATFLACSITGLSSCSTKSNSSSESSSINSSNTASTGSDPSGSQDTSALIVSGTLRLWMQTPTTLNPLVSSQYQWQEISRLFYESLYDINSRQEAVPDLAEECITSENGLTYTIKLKKSVLFSDNTAFDSADVLSTVQFIQNPASQSIYFNQLKNVASAAAVDANTIQFVLLAADPFFLYELDFPILASEKIANNAIPYQPGTGRYKIDSYEKGSQMKASLNSKNRNSSEYKIKNITVLELADTREAMEAFGDDKVDIVLLHDSTYETYYLRNDVKIVRYPSSQYLFFEMNQNTGKALLDVAKADYIRLLLQDSLLYDGLKSIFCTVNSMPFLSTSPLVHLNQCKDILPVAKSSNPFINEKKKLEIIYPKNDLLKQKLMEQFAILLNREKIPYNITGYDAAQYPAAILSGGYDIAVREAQLTSNPDPSWLYLPTTLRTITGAETISKAGTPQYMQVQTALSQKYLTPNIKITAEEFCGIMNQAYRYGPYIGIGFRINGVLQSKRIKGQFDPNSFSQYNKLEEVWVWSGQ